MSAIELKAVGPIDRLKIPVPKGGGVVVLKGRNGSGKSYALAGVAGLVSKDARKVLRASDGATSGTVDGFGVTLRLGRSNTARGELECETLDAACDPSVLVDPGIKDPVAADSKRLATLIRLANIKISADQWGQLFEGGLEQYRNSIDLDALSGDDPVNTADRIRRRLHDIGLKLEKTAKSAEAEADSLVCQVAEVDMDAPADEEALGRCADDATAKVLTARQRKASSIEAAQAAEAAERRLEAAERSYEGVTIEDAKQREAAARQRFDEAERLVRAAEKAMADAKSQELAAKHAVAHAVELRKSAESHEAMVASARAVLAAGRPSSPSEEEIAELVAEQAVARDALAYAKMVNGARRTLAKASGVKAQAVTLLDEAEQLRAIARSTDSVLEKALEAAGFTAVRVSEGRLCVPSDRGNGMEPYSELSHGERWAMALDLAVRGIGKGGLLTVKQEAWESLDPDNREFVAGLARERGLVILTAEAADGALRAEEYVPDCEVVHAA